jgi:hypothetical protein
LVCQRQETSGLQSLLRWGSTVGSGRAGEPYPNIMTGSNPQQPASRPWHAMVGNARLAAHHQRID